MMLRSGRCRPAGGSMEGGSMTQFVGLDVSQKLTAICIVDETGRRLWRGQCATDPGQIERMVRGHAGEDARIGIETGPMTPWLVHELRARELNVTCLDARHASAALKMQMNKTDQNDAEGLAQIMRTGWYRPVHVKSLDAHRARALLGARAQLVGMTTRLSNHIRGVLKTFGMLPGAMRGLPFDRRVEQLLVDRDDLTPIVGPMLAAWRQLREQIAAFDKAVRALAKADATCRLLMSVPGIGVLSVLAYVSTVEDPARFARSRSVGAHMGLTPRQYQSGEMDRSGRISKCGDTLARTLLYEAAVVILTRVKRASSLKDWAQVIAKRSGPGKARVALARKLSVILHSIWRSGEPFRWAEPPAST
ncbi:IS110 family transposase [Lichenicoccus sp.]|uniref:IS110 family transposase n=1 Tax=Lichenicoccus sp. TaxID=2781899 RepID=UPI003D12430C